MMRGLAVLLLGCAVATHAASLKSYANGQPLPVYTARLGSRVPVDSGDQTNNFKVGHHVLLLSNKGLTDLEGIAGLRVIADGREVPLAEVKDLHLFLNHNELRRLPDEFFTMRNVIFVYLYSNHLSEIPPELATMKGLEGIYLTDNGIRRIPPEIFSMTWLRKLQVSKNHLTEVPAAIGNLTELIHLNLSDNAIEVLPDSIARLTKLRVCDFSDNRIHRLPEAFGQVPIMHQLRICNNPIASLPKGFENVPGSIDITGTRIDIESLSPALRSKIGREKRNPIGEHPPL